MSHTFIRAFENRNKPILARNKPVERIHFNIVKLAAGETFQYRLPGMESVVVPMAGTCDLTVDGTSFLNVGRRSSVWDGKAMPSREPEVLPSLLQRFSTHRPAEVFAVDSWAG